ASRPVHGKANRLNESNNFRFFIFPYFLDMAQAAKQNKDCSAPFSGGKGERFSRGNMPRPDRLAKAPRITIDTPGKDVKIVDCLGDEGNCCILPPCSPSLGVNHTYLHLQAGGVTTRHRRIA